MRGLLSENLKKRQYHLLISTRKIPEKPTDSITEYPIYDVTGYELELLLERLILRRPELITMLQQIGRKENGPALVRIEILKPKMWKE